MDKINLLFVFPEIKIPTAASEVGGRGDASELCLPSMNLVHVC